MGCETSFNRDGSASNLQLELDAAATILAFVTAISAVTLLLQTAFVSKTFRRLRDRTSTPDGAAARQEINEPDRIAPTGVFLKAKEHVLAHGGHVIFMLEMARMLCCFVLLALSAITLVAHIKRETGREDSDGRLGSHQHHWLSRVEGLQIVHCFTFVSSPCSRRV